MTVDKDFLKQLQDKIYELEGLVHLSIVREEIQEDFLRLILRKSKEICDIIDGFADGVENKSINNLDDEPNSVNDVNSDYNFDEEYFLQEDEAESNREGNDTDSTKSNESPDLSTSFESQSRGKLVFSINDRFRFRQALFDNSDVDFNNTLALVASMENYEEAEDYFLNDQNWDPQNDYVKDFLVTIKKYFG